MLGAIGLTLGQRADVAAIMDKNRKCVVEITYDVVEYDLQQWFADNDLDYDDEVVVRRELTADGKSRAFINDTPVNNKLLKEFGSFLIDVHSQHQSLLIGQPGCGSSHLCSTGTYIYSLPRCRWWANCLSARCCGSWQSREYL